MNVEKVVLTSEGGGWRFEGVGDLAGLINSGRV